MHEPVSSEACPIEADTFAASLEKIFESDKERNFFTNAELIKDISEFSLEELNIALSSLSNLRAGDEHGCVVELLKYGNDALKEEILACFNRILYHLRIDSSWHQSIFRMLPKDGDLSDVGNWRPIAILPILYKVFAKMLYFRLGFFDANLMTSTLLHLVSVLKMHYSAQK